MRRCGEYNKRISCMRTGKLPAFIFQWDRQRRRRCLTRSTASIFLSYFLSAAIFGRLFISFLPPFMVSFFLTCRLRWNFLSLYFSLSLRLGRLICRCLAESPGGLKISLASKASNETTPLPPANTTTEKWVQQRHYECPLRTLSICPTRTSKSRENLWRIRVFSPCCDVLPQVHLVCNSLRLRSSSQQQPIYLNV